MANEVDHKAAQASKQKAVDERRKAAEAQVDAGVKAKEEAVKQADRFANAQPTPTQRENDLAKLGVHVADKEDDGSGPDVAVVRSVQPVEQGSAPYNTRDAAPAQKQAAPQVKQSEPHKGENK